MVIDFDYSESISLLNKAMREMRPGGLIWNECEICATEQYHDAEDYCPNYYIRDEEFDMVCGRRKDFKDMTMKRENLNWLSPMLEYYWQYGIAEVGLSFLRKKRLQRGIRVRLPTETFIFCLLNRFRSLVYNKYLDAANPYGQTILAFLVIEGWHIRLVLKLVGIGVFLTICVVSIVTAVSHSLDVGMTAGSYAASLLAVLLAVFAFLSAVI